MFKRYWWMLLAMIPIGAMAGFFISAVVTYVMPKKYESTAVIEVRDRNPMGSGSGGLNPQISPGNSLEIIKSRNVLMKVVENLDLTKMGLG